MPVESARRRKNRHDAFKRAGQYKKPPPEARTPQKRGPKHPPWDDLCGARKKNGERCMLVAGYGTNHKGIGKCQYHGGKTPTHVMAAAKAEMRTLLGKEMEINPFEAIMWCIRIRAGEVRWLSEKMAQLEEKEWTESTMLGKQFHLYAKERQAAMHDLTRFSAMAISMGIAERYVRLAEVYGQTIALLIEKVVGKLDPTPAQREALPAAVRQALIEVQAAETGIIEGKAKELTAA